MDNHNCYNTKSGYEVYRPVTLFFHHYPTTDILEKVKEKQTKIVDTTRIINKIKKKINNYVNKKYQQLSLDIENHKPVEEKIEMIRTKMTPAEFAVYNDGDILSWDENGERIEKTLSDTLIYFHILRDQRNNLRVLERDPKTGDEEVCNKAILVGYYSDEIGGILKNIEETRKIPPKNSEAYGLLEAQFGSDFENIWGRLDRQYYTELDFLPFFVFPHSTVFYIQRIIELYYGYKIEHQYLWANINLNDAEQRTFLLCKLYYSLYDETIGLTHDVIKDFFEKLGFSNDEITKRVFNTEEKIAILNKKFDSNKISERDRDREIESLQKMIFTVNNLKNDQPLNSTLLGYLQYQNLTFETLLDKRVKIGQWPDENPYFALNSEINTASRIFLELKNRGEIQYTNVNQNRTLANFGNIERNEIHWVGLPKIANYLQSNQVVDFKNTLFMRDYIQSTLNRYFYKLETVEQLTNKEEYKAVDAESIYLDENSRIFNLYLKGHEMIELPADLKYRLECRNMVEIRISIDQYIRNSQVERFNLRDIFNRVILSNDMPFARLYDEQRSENVYRVYKPAFGIGSVDKITISQLEKWIHRENLTLNLAKLTKIHEPKKCLTFKLRLCNQQISRDTKEIKSKTLTVNRDHVNKYNITYKDGLYEENVEEYLITDNGRFVYEHSAVFMDVFFYSLQGTIEVKVIYHPNGCSTQLFYTIFIDKINEFISTIKTIPYLAYVNEFEPVGLLQYDGQFSNQSVLNLSSILEYKYQSKFHLKYDFLKRIVSIFTPFFHIVEPTYVKGTAVEFLHKGEWKKNGYIAKSNFNDGTYDIEYNDGRTAVSVKGVKPHLIKQKGERGKNFYLNMRYKRVSNYIKETPIIELLKRNLEWGLNIDEIKEKIQKQYDVSADALDELNKRVGEATEQIRSQTDRRVELNGIDIKIYLEPQDDEFNNKTYMIELDHYRNLGDYSNIVQLLDLIFRIYYTLYDKEDITFIDKNFDIDTSEATYEKRQQLEADLEQQKNIEEAEVLAEFGFEFEEEAAEQEETNELIERPKKEQIINDEILDFDYEMLGNSNNFFLEKLYRADRKMFYWESDNKKQKYTIACMGTRRYPKVVGPERFKYIFEKYRRGLGLTYLENKNLPDSNEQLVDEEYCEPDKPIGSTNKCVSIKYGSQEEPAQWSNHYMCPKIWCIRDKIPLHPRDLIDGENPEAGCDRFESQGDITLEELKETFKSYKEYQKAEYIIWRICKKCNQDILKHNIKCPECKGAPLEPTNTNMIPTKTTSLYVVEKDTNYIYPGFVSGDKHPSKIPAVCCFNNPNTRLSEKFSISNYKTNYNTLAYIQTFGKELQPGRFGQLPIAFSGFMDLDIDYFNATSIRCDHTSKNYYYRFGILSSPSENSLNILSFYLLHNDMSVGVDKDSLAAMTDKLLYDIIRKMTSSVLMRYPILEYAFRSSGVSSLQNYIEFLVSDDPKPDFTVLQILNQSMEWLEDKERLGVDPSIIQTGLNIFIFSVNDDGKMVIELPRGFVQPYELGKRAKSVLLFRNKNINNMLEPIVFSKSGCDRAGGDNTKRANKFFEYDHPLIKKIMAILEKLDKDRSPISLFNNRDNKYLELTDFHDRTIDWLMMEHRVNLEKLGYKIERIVVDSSNLVVGVITNNTFVPTYPANYTSSLDVFSKIKYLDMLESELGNYLRVSESILGLIKYKRDEFSYLEPIKVVKSNIENDSYYTGYYLSCGVIVPFEPTKNISNIYLPSIQIDFRAIERSIVDYKENYTYTKRLRLETLKKMSITESDYEYVIEDGKLKGIIISLIDLNIFNTFIPMAEIEWDGRMPENLYSGPMPKYNLEQTIENYNKLYTGIRERLPCRVIGVVMNDLTKIVERIQLETGDFIDVIPNTPIYKRFKNSKYRYLLHMIQDIELDDIFAEEQYNYETFHTDDRIDYIMSMDYNKYSYDRFRFEVARLLSLSDVDSAKMGGRIVPKREITELLSNNRIGLQEKRQLLSKMIVSLVHNNIIYTKVDIKSVGKSQKFVEQSCSVHRLKNQCSADPFCNWVEETQGQSLAEFKEANIQKVKNILSTLEKNRESITKYINNMRKYLEYNGRQWSDSDMDMNINNKLEIDYLRKGNCRLVLLDDENLDFIRSKYIRKLVDEILRNPIRRKEIMENSIRIVETRLSYNVYPNEVFYTEKDIKLNTAELRTLYQRNRRSKLRVLNHFTRNSSNYYNVVEPVENNQYIEQKLRDNSYTLYLNSGLIDFKITGLERMVVSDVHQTQNVVILDDNRAILDIIRKNTPLDSWRVNNVGKNIRFSVVEKE